MLKDQESDIPKVSIIVPCYNHESYIQECIGSILSQTYPNIELIVIDDGSSDSSPILLAELSQQYGFRFIHRPNKGLCATLNEGITLASGKYFAACASDDRLAIDKITKQVEYMEAHPDYGMCYGKMIRFDESGRLEKIDRAYKEGWIFEDLMLNYFSIPAVTQLIRKDVFKKVGLYDESLWIEDLDMWLRIAKHYQIGFVNDYVAYYRRHESNISRNKEKMFNAQYAIVMKWRDDPNFERYRTYWELKWFAKFSKTNQKLAKQFLSTVYRNLHRPSIWRYLLRYWF